MLEEDLHYPPIELATGLYLGSFCTLKDFELKFTHILNCANEISYSPEDYSISNASTQYLKIDYPSLWDQGKVFIKFFNQCFLFVNASLQNNQDPRVLVHCKFGVNRYSILTNSLMGILTHNTLTPNTLTHKSPHSYQVLSLV
jgi:hypothetical protein